MVKKYLIKKNAGFTLIELLVTTTIILLMAALAIPAFSKYGRKAQFYQKVEEVNALINEVYISSENPEKSISKYGMYTDFNKLILVKRIPDDPSTAASELADSIIKEVEIDSSKYFLKDFKVDGTADTGEDYFSCEYPGKCCRKSTDRTVLDYCADQSISYVQLFENTYFELYDNKTENSSDLKAKIKLTTTPFFKIKTVFYQRTDSGWAEITN